MVTNEHNRAQKLTSTAYSLATVHALEQTQGICDNPSVFEDEIESITINARLLLSLADISIENSKITILGGNTKNGKIGLFAGLGLLKLGAKVTTVGINYNINDENILSFIRAGGNFLPLSHESVFAQTFCKQSTSANSQSNKETFDRMLQADLFIDAMSDIDANNGLAELTSKLVTTITEHTGHTVSSNTKDLGHLRRPLVLAVDLPSGVGIDDGTLPGPFIPADITVSFGLLKPCSLLPPAAYICGKTVLLDIGLNIDELQPKVEAMTAQSCANSLRLPSIKDDKYSRGVVGLITGSEQYPGAAVLSTRAAASCNVGMIRYIGPPASTQAVLTALPEATAGMGRVQSMVLGSGVPSNKAASTSEIQREKIQAFFEELKLQDESTNFDSQPRNPSSLVVDAGALDLLPHSMLPPNILITPHFGELVEVLARYGEEVNQTQIAAAPLHWAIKTWELTGASILLKGAITIVICGKQGENPKIYTTGYGPAWLSTAGSGDVLAGIEGACLASQADLIKENNINTGKIAAAASYIHGLAATLASHSYQRAWQAPILLNHNAFDTFINNAKQTWNFLDIAGNTCQSVGHPIHASQLVNKLAEAQELLYKFVNQ